MYAKFLDQQLVSIFVGCQELFHLGSHLFQENIDKFHARWRCDNKT